MVHLIGSDHQPPPAGQVLQFPSSREPAPAAGTELEPAQEVLEGELLSEEQSAAVEERLRGRTRVTQLAHRAIGLVVVVGDSERTGTAVGKAAVRAAVTVGQGLGSWKRRAWDAGTMGVYRRQIKAAEATGNQERLAQWIDRKNQATEQRHKRIMDLPALALGVGKACAGGLVALVVLLLTTGLLAQLSGAGSFTGVVSGALTLTRWVGTAIAVVWTPLLVLAPVFVLVAAWREGMRVATPPRWLMTPGQISEYNSEITPDLITAALRHMKITRLERYLAGGGALEFIVTPREQGGGTYTQIRLPLGVAAAELLPAAKVELLAGNLGRHKHEVWPQRQKDTDARVLDLWIADKGTMDRPAPPWPLLTDGAFDVLRDRLPWGVTMRGEQVSVGMLQKHWLIGATSNQGKSVVMRILALGLALDPTTEHHIADLKGDGDWSMFGPRAVTLIEGSSQAHAEATARMLEWAVGEVQRRYDTKRKMGITGPITRELSRRPGSGFHPIYLWVDECQVGYAAAHPVGGAKDDSRIAKAAKSLHDQARAVHIHLIQATQRPDDRTLPARVREGAHVRCALNVPNHEAAKMVLGEAAERGARPQDLRHTIDAGTVVATGPIEDIPKGQAFIIVRTHYVTTKEAYGVIARAMTIMRRAGRAVGVLTPQEPPEDSDHLANIARVIDQPRVGTHQVLKRLSELDPLEYESWTFQDLTACLREHGVRVKKIHGYMTVAAEDVAQAIRDRVGGVDATARE